MLGMKLQNLSIGKSSVTQKLFFHIIDSTGLGVLWLYLAEFLQAVIDFHFTLHPEVNQLPNGHAGVDALQVEKLIFQRPMIAKSHIFFPAVA